MAFTPQNFVDQVGPAVSAEFLNGVDITVNQALQGVETTAELIALVGGGGGPGQNAILLTASTPAIVVQASSSGIVADFSQAVGQASLFSGTTNVSELAVWSIVLNGCTATVNVADNAPVAGKPIGYYAFTALPTNNGSATISAVYGGQTYLITVTITKSLAGAAGAPGATGATGPTGPAGAGGITLVLSQPNATVLAYANGGIPSFAGLNGQASVLNAGVNESELATWSVVGSGLTGTVNTADNTPVAGHPIGYYQVTAMTQASATLTISAVYLGNTLTAVYQVTQVPTGYQIVATLPVSGPALFQGNVVFLTTDNQLYRYTGSAWTVAVPAVNISGLLTAAQIASLAASQITGTLTAAQIASITAAQLTGQITSTQIANGSITTPLLAAGAVNTAALAAGSVVAASIASGTITAAQIAGGTITGANIAAGTILAGNIAAATITAGNLAANSVTATQVAANAITTNAIQAGAVTAAQIGVTQLSAISANIGTVTAGLLQNSGGSVYFDLNNSWLVFNNGVNMDVGGLGFGAGGNYLHWFGPTQSSASNFAACTDALAIYYLKTDGTYKFGTSQQLPATTQYTATQGGVSYVSFTVTIPASKTSMLLELCGSSGVGNQGNNTVPTQGGSGGSGAYSKSLYTITGQAGKTVTINLSCGAQAANSTIVSGTFTITTMTAPPGGAGQAGTATKDGVGGVAAAAATGGNLLNLPGLPGGGGTGTAAGTYNTGTGAPGVAGQFISGNVGSMGLFGAGTAIQGLPAVAAVTFS